MASLISDNEFTDCELSSTFLDILLNLDILLVHKPGQLTCENKVPFQSTEKIDPVLGVPFNLALDHKHYSFFLFM